MTFEPSLRVCMRDFSLILALKLALMRLWSKRLCSLFNLN